jgi:hypothetical protein
VSGPPSVRAIRSASRMMVDRITGSGRRMGQSSPSRDTYAGVTSRRGHPSTVDGTVTARRSGKSWARSTELVNVSNVKYRTP